LSHAKQLYYGNKDIDHMNEATNLQLGTRMADGSIFAGSTLDGKQHIYAMPTDLDVTTRFNDAAKSVKRLNAQKALGHDDWQIPSLEHIRVLQQNQNEGALKGTFHTASKRHGNVFPDWYWSSTEERDHPFYVWVARFSGGGGGVWYHKDYHSLSVRPVRLVEISSPAPR
jgi:hypothetical protein